MTATGALAASPNEAPKEAFEQRLAQAQQEGRISGLHSLLVSQGGTTIVEHYQPGEDEAWGRPLGTVVFAPDVLHDLRSVSKSVVGLLYGIALANGTNSRSLMATERPTVGEPGEKWTYCGGATALLGRLIAKGSGEALLPYARRVLFDPMGFGPAEWMKGDDGEPHTASGLRLLPRDMLKVGELALAGGAWNGKQTVPADWVRRATTPVVTIDRSRSYGYHWYIGDVLAGTPPQVHHWVGGIGWGGQRLYVIPALNLVVAMNCGNYHKSGMEQSRITITVLTEVVLPSFI